MSSVHFKYFYNYLKISQNTCTRHGHRVLVDFHVQLPSAVLYMLVQAHS